MRLSNGLEIALVPTTSLDHTIDLLNKMFVIIQCLRCSTDLTAAMPAPELKSSTSSLVAKKLSTSVILSPHLTLTLGKYRFALLVR